MGRTARPSNSDRTAGSSPARSPRTISSTLIAVVAGTSLASRRAATPFHRRAARAGSRSGPSNPGRTVPRVVSPRAGSRLGAARAPKPVACGFARRQVVTCVDADENAPCGASALPGVVAALGGGCDVSATRRALSCPAAGRRSGAARSCSIPGSRGRPATPMARRARHRRARRRRAGVRGGWPAAFLRRCGPLAGRGSTCACCTTSATNRWCCSPSAAAGTRSATARPRLAVWRASTTCWPPTARTSGTPTRRCPRPCAPLPVVSAQGVRLRLADGRELVDGMSSWWAAVHGYRHPVLDAAVRDQLGAMSHVMFGGLTHGPAVELARLLVDVTPAGLEHVFLCDSGSVSVEVAIKMCLQYQRSRGRPGKHRLMTWRGGYHGDTFGAMSVCDPDGGMHALWRDVLPRQVFAGPPPVGVRARLRRRAGAAGRDARRRAGRGDRRAGRAGRRRHALPRPSLPARAARAVPDPRRAAGLRRDRHRVRADGRALRRRARGRRARTSCASARR